MNRTTTLAIFCKRNHNLLKWYCTEQPNNKTTTKKISRKTQISRFLAENAQLAALKPHIPPQYFNIRRNGTVQNLYLICPDTAKLIASHVKTSIESNPDQLVAETNAGLGLIATELLEGGINLVRLYESCPDFRLELKDFAVVYPGQVELFTKDIFHLHRYSFMDKQDCGNRLEQLLKNVPKKKWTDEPVMTIVGSMPTLDFIRYLIKCLCLQKDIVSHGRFQIFAVMQPKHYAILHATPQNNLLAYQYWSTLFNLFFDSELLEKIPRKVYLPWETKVSKALMNRYPANLEPDKLYLVKFNFKKELPVDVEHLLPLFYFGKYFYSRGSNRVIPTIEKWVPGCGLNILLPKLKHPDYFADINIFTRFRELAPSQLLAVFKEMVNYPTFSGSSFVAMIENNLVKTETVESDVAESTASAKNIEDIEENLDTK